MQAGTDGKQGEEPHAKVVIDTSDDLDVWRFRCPNGHTSWEPTNGGIYCHSCSQVLSHTPDENPQHHTILDQRTGQEIPWSRVTLR